MADDVKPTRAFSPPVSPGTTIDLHARPLKPALKALLARLELADRMFALFEEYHGTGRHEAYGDMVKVYHAYRAAKEADDG